MNVRVNDIPKFEIALSKQSFVRFRIPSRVNDGRLTRLARGNHIGLRIPHRSFKICLKYTIDILDQSIVPPLMETPSSE